MIRFLHTIVFTPHFGIAVSLDGRQLAVLRTYLEVERFEREYTAELVEAEAIEVST
jgi:hypothetical protein